METPQEKLKNLLLSSIPSAKLTSGGKNVTIRCMYCGDSKNPRHAHMGICLGYDDKPQFFHCFKCHVSGIINHNILLEWGIYDTNTFASIDNYNKKILSLSKNKKYKDRNIYYLNNKYIFDCKLSRLKLKYINNRLGIDLNYKDILSEKIVLNLKDLITYNNIKKITRNSNIINQLDESFIGFISQDNAFINMRNLRKPGNVYKSIDKRYINYNIFGKFNNTERYYTLPTNINLTYPKRIKLHIAEGPFDILSIYHNLRKEKTHNIYSSILGSGYLNICKHFICKMKLINLEVHIYIDNDVKYNTIYSLSNFLNVYQIPFYLHRNIKKGEKDFGVPINRINEQIQKI